MKLHIIIIALAAIVAVSGLRAQEAKAVPTDDARARRVRHLNAAYTMPFYTSKDEWLKRRAELRMQILVANGLYPQPMKTPLNAKVFGKIDRGDYSVEKVYFESLPGFYVTGNLYRPTKGVSKKPGILNPHGHWRDGRLANEESGSISGRCISQARMGYVAFSWDMTGYVDSQQIPHRTFAGKPLWGLSMMSLQTWNSIRALDFLQSLPDVDPDRIGVTGESGGGTQTFLLTAVDDRVQWAAPVNMISAHMQGGCICENAPGLRIDTNNMEIGALFAPKPMLLVSATGDWTVNTPKIEYPAINEVYSLLGASDQLSWVQIDAPHNYNQASREAVYGFFAKWIDGRGEGKPVKEPKYTMEPVANLRVFPDGKLPEGARTPDQVTQYWIEQSEKQLAAAQPKTAGGLAQFRKTYGVALQHALAARLPATAEIIAYETQRLQPTKEYQMQRFSIGRAAEGDRVPAAIAIPTGNARKIATLLIHPQGKTAGESLAKMCFGKGQVVMTIDAFNTGEAKAERPDRGFFTTYNRTDTAERVQDILTAVASLHSRLDITEVNLVGLEQFGPLTLLANALAGNSVNRCAVNAYMFKSDDDIELTNKLFTPSLRRAGDLRAAMTLIAPRPLFIHSYGEWFNVQWAQNAYAAAGASAMLRLEKSPATESEIAEWLMK